MGVKVWLKEWEGVGGGSEGGREPTRDGKVEEGKGVGLTVAGKEGET